MHNFYVAAAMVFLLLGCGGGSSPDTDGDGLSDELEEFHGTDINDPDSDDDGLIDGDEIEVGSDPLDPDTDDDTLLDGAEVNEHGSSPLLIDTDEDNITDPAEVTETLTNPAEADTDFDGIRDDIEITDYGSSPSAVDTDGDGLADNLEVERGTNPQSADTDQDGIDDPTEAFETSTNPVEPDTDGDGMYDGEERELGTNPLFDDTDFDGLLDGDEQAYGASPLSADTDGDGLTDPEEVTAGTDAANPDTDGDGLADGREAMFSADPLNPDTDGDGALDGEEVEADSDPTTDDGDADGLSDFEEIRVYMSAPAVPDTDGDGILDGVEAGFRMDPADPDDGAADLDEDGVTSADEVIAGTHPRIADSDSDGLLDGAEATAGTNPLDPDSDDDGVNDGAEVRVGSNPLSRDSDGDGIEDAVELQGLEDLDSDGLVGIMDVDADGDGWPDADELRPTEDLDDDGFANILDVDSDGDGLRDGDEVAAGLNPLAAGDADRDPDGDDLLTRDEIAAGSDPFVRDSDGDGIDDGIEVANDLDPSDGSDAALDFDNDTLSNLDELTVHGTDPNDDDSDDDGLLDDREIAFGADPLNTDTDGDGVLDGDESTPGLDIDGDGRLGVLDTDSDNDGVSDGEERALGLRGGDTDGDGVSDADEIAAGSDPSSKDTDMDGLGDLAELDGCPGIRGAGTVVTNPLSADTDGDGLSDAVECALRTNPAIADHDGDGALDGTELEACVVGAAGCGAGGWRSRTDPFDPDTDDDGVPDGFDPDPHNPDADGDGRLDNEELVAGFNMTVEEFTPAAGEDFVPDTTTLAVPRAGAPWFVVAAEVETTESVMPGEVRLDTPPTVEMTVNGRASDHALRWEGARWISTAPRRPDEDDALVDFAGSGFRVLRVVLMGLPETSFGPPAGGVRTFADDGDSDGDGIGDGDETAGFWMEAEHYAAASAVRVAEPGASNGIAVRAVAGVPVFSLAANDWGFETGETYSIFVRTRRIAAFDPDTAPVVTAVGGTPDCNFVGDPACGPGTCFYDPFDESGFCGNMPVNNGVFTPTSEFEWRSGGTYFVTTPTFPVVVSEGVESSARWEIDRVAILPLIQQPQTLAATYNELGVPTVHRVIGIGGDDPLEFVQRLPWGLSDPMEADTDGDGMREFDGLIPDSLGWLTDGAERRLRINSFDIDSDLDAAIGQTEFHDDFSAIAYTGAALMPMGGPDGRPDYRDDNDPSPRPLDTDQDGLLDPVEIQAELASQDRACRISAGCPLADFCAACPEEDYDDESDLLGRCSAMAGGALPLCFYADDDRDDDGLTDGAEDLSRDGRLSLGETDPNLADTDGDCIPDGIELGLRCPQGAGTIIRTGADVAHCTGLFTRGATGFVPAVGFEATLTDPSRTDTDRDGVSDGDASDGEGLAGIGEDASCNGRVDDGETDPSRVDTDADLLADGVELGGPTDALDPDSDGDGLLDGEEVHHYGTDPILIDTDGDNLEDGAEVRPIAPTPATNPLVRDTDMDGIDDDDEILGTGPLASCTFDEVCGVTGDCDDGGACTFGPTDPTRADTDGDGIDDFVELTSPRSNPNRGDTDGDGISDADEVAGAGPFAPFGMGNPRDSDTDRDGFLDLIEIYNGSDPTNASSVPLTLAIAPGGLVIDAASFTATATGLLATGLVGLGCEGRASTAIVDGTVELRRVGGGYDVIADGDFNVLGAMIEGTRREEAIWTGQAMLTADGRTFEPGVTTARLSSLSLAAGGVVVQLDPPSCEVDTECPSGEEGSCVAGRCAGTLGADQFEVCSGELLDAAAVLELPEPTEEPTETPAGARAAPRFMTPDLHVVLPRETVSTGVLTQASAHDPEDFPWEGRTCIREPDPIRISASMLGDFRFRPNPSVPIGTPPAPGTPAFDFDGTGGIDLPDVNPIPFMHALADVDFNVTTGQFDFTSGFPFEVPIGDFPGGAPAGGSFAEQFNTRIPEGNACRWDAGRGMYSCEFEYTKRASPPGGGAKVRQFTVRGRVDVHTHGRIPFQTIEAHDFEGLSCGEGIDLCQDGQLAVNAVVEIPIKQIPGVDLVVEGDLLADVTTRDGDDLFVGMFGTVRYEHRAARALNESGYLPFPFPFKMEVGQATGVMSFDGQRLEQIAFDSTKGFQLGDIVDIPGLPLNAASLFDPTRGRARGCIDVNTGRMEGIATVYPAGFELELGFGFTPPFDRDGPNLSAGTLSGSGSVGIPEEFGVDLEATVEGEIGFDGNFEFTGSFDDDLRFPGLPAISLPDASFAVSNRGAEIAGTLPLPGFGRLEASGEIRSNGGFDVELEGTIAPGGFRMADVHGHIGSTGVVLEGNVRIPGLTNATLRGYYRNETDWRFVSVGTVSVPISGGELTSVTVTLSPSGLILRSAISIPALGDVRVEGEVQTSGAMRLEGALNVSAGPVRLGGGRLIVSKTAGGFVTVGGTARATLAGLTIARATFSVDFTGAFRLEGSASFVGQTFRAVISRTAGGSVSASGSVSVGACITRVCIGGTISLDFNDGNVRATFRGSGLTLSVSSSGCVSWELSLPCGRFSFACPGIGVTVCL